MGTIFRCKRPLNSFLYSVVFLHETNTTQKGKVFFRPNSTLVKAGRDVIGSAMCVHPDALKLIFLLSHHFLEPFPSSWPYPINCFQLPERFVHFFFYSVHMKKPSTSWTFSTDCLGNRCILKNTPVPS